jgi:nucleotide-binding universal stress UspA family protein
MFQRILIPVDLSERNRSAVEIGRELAKQSGGRITLVHVIETIEYLSFGELRDFYDRLEQSAREGMKELSEGFAVDGIESEHVIIFGKRHEEIIKCAIDNQADLIVMSSHRVDPDRPSANFGSISYRIAVLSPSAVLLVK